MSNTTFESAKRDVTREASAIANEASNAASEVADTVAGAASRIQDKATEFGKRAVDQFNATSEYLRDHDVNAIVSDAKSWVRSHPAQALVAAVAVGFVAGALLRRR